MMSVMHPELCVRTAFRHTCLITLYCELMCTPFINLVDYGFAFDSLAVNLYLIYLSWKFKTKPDSSSSRKLFRASLFHLPALLILMLIHKKKKSKEVADS